MKLKMRYYLLRFCLPGLFYAIGRTMLLSLFGWSLAAQNPEPAYSKVFIHTTDERSALLASLGLPLDCGVIRYEDGVEGIFSAYDLQNLRLNGFIYDVLIADMDIYYREILRAAPPSVLEKDFAPAGYCDGPVWNDPVHFQQGSLAGYFTYEELLTQLDLMAALFPDLITPKALLSPQLTNEGRPQYYVKISDHAALDEDEPEMLYTALHHAREPMSMMQLIYFMWYLLENYGTDPEATGIVNGQELFFIPCVNPDGYIHNQTTNPWGGGMWRKNKRANADGSLGVDLNRNYGYQWGLDDLGSSSDPNSAVYRGTAPFSEPETDNIRQFVSGRYFKSCLNFHTYGNLYIYPWGYDATPTADDDLYRIYADRQTWFSRYKTGTNDITVGYLTNGEADDWFYGDVVAKPPVIAMTPEVGNSQWGFWPPSTEIFPYCRKTLPGNIEAAKLNGVYAEIQDDQSIDINAPAGTISAKLLWLGLSAGPVTITALPLSDGLSFTAPMQVVNGNSPLQSQNLLFEYTAQNLLPGDLIQYKIIVDNGFFSTEKIMSKIYEPDVLFSHSFNSFSQWSPVGFYLAANDYFSSGSSASESPTLPYNGNTDRSLTMSNAVSLTGVDEATLQFRTHWDMYNNRDYWQALISTDNGSSWEPLCGSYTKDADEWLPITGQPVYSGLQREWVREEISLNGYIGQEVKIKFQFVTTSQNHLEYAGLFIDEVEIFTRPQGQPVMAKLYLEGAYNNNTGLMRTDMAEGGVLPLSHPFGEEPHNYFGTEQVVSFPAGTVDWVLAELRDKDNPEIVVSRKAALLRNDGMIMSTAGEEGVRFSEVVPDTYYLAIYPYSHLAIISSYPVPVPALAVYDFSTGAAQALGPQQLKNIAPGIYALYAGDYDHSGVINNLDFNRWIQDNAAVNTYLSWDGNLSGVINAADYNLWYANRSKVGHPFIQY